MENVSKHTRIRSRTGQAARNAGSKKEQTAQCTTGFAADGFLKHQFLPLYGQAANTPEQSKTEKGFFQSLSILKDLYGCESMDVEDKHYPYNMLLSLWHVSQQLLACGQQLTVFITEDENKTCLASSQTCDTNSTLYYIPVIPLYRLLQNRKRKQAGELLLSVFAYLYHVAGVPHYREPYVALEYYYDMMKEWLVNDADSYEEADLNSNFSEISAAEHYGDVMLRKISNRCHLACFYKRLERFKVKDSFEADCLQVAKTAYELYQHYPCRAVFDNIIKEEAVEYDDTIITMEQYLSFIASAEGWLYHNIEQMVNNDFNECVHMEEPTIVQVFDPSVKPEKKDLAFEHRLLELIRDLCSILNTIP